MNVFEARQYIREVWTVRPNPKLVEFQEALDLLVEAARIEALYGADILTFQEALHAYGRNTPRHSPFKKGSVHDQF